MFALISLLELDQGLFHIVNGDWTNSFFDWLLPVWRDNLFWVPVYLFIIIFMVLNYGRKGYWFIIFLLLTVGTSDIVSSKIIKPSVERLRPCREPSIENERVLVRCGSGFSFTSSHATNHFAMSIFLFMTLGQRFKRIKPIVVFWAASVSYAQVYVGVHYPLDVLTGAILGGLIGVIWSLIYARSGQRSLNWNEV